MPYLRLLLILLCCASASPVKAQFFQYCTDSTRIANDFQPCGTDFTPVCGCDQVTYRNECSAYFWGGLFSGSWTTNSVCTSFYFDFYPTAITYFPGRFSVFLKERGSASLYIYDAFGKLQHTDIFYTSAANETRTKEINVQNLDLGIYNMIVVVGNEVQYLKFAKVTKFE